MEQNRIFDIIINLLIGIKNNNLLVEKIDSGDELTLTGCSYLLNQTIRQYQIPKDHYYVSQKAFELWSKIRTDSIFEYTYRDTIVKNTNEIVFIDKFRGSEKMPYESTNLVYGNSFIYNDVFTDEHIVTVSNIIDELLALPNYDYFSIKKILDKIYICKMLKEEDHAIKNKKNRSTDYREVITDDYLSVGISVKDFDAKSALQDIINELEIQIRELKIKQLRSLDKN